MQDGAVKPLFVTSGMVIKDDTPAWQLKKHELNQLTKADLESILEAGGYGRPLLVNKDKKHESVDFVECNWNRIVATIADRNVVVPLTDADEEEAESGRSRE